MKLKALIAQYVAFKKSLGADFEGNRKSLNTFSRQMGEEIDVADITPQQVETFLAGTGPITSFWHLKYAVLHGLYHYAITRGFATNSPLPTTVPKLSKPFIPYIYPQAELRRLFNSTAVCTKRSCQLEPHTLRAILVLLYGAGLRVSEAVALTVHDVDLAAAVITIRDTKFNKTRIVPLGRELNQLMAQYAATRRRGGHCQSGTAPFFVMRDGRRVTTDTIDHRFKQLREYASVSRVDGASCQPRLHDLRHSFAVHRVESWYRQGADVQKLLPKLATYLGHVTISGTQRYLTMTPELLHEASKRFERYALKEESND